ncbi:MAG: helix-turn-helix transcriptional regulator [Pseudomonadota bacterium]
MTFEDDQSGQEAPSILRQSNGHFEPKARIGPAKWPHHDILWIHSGRVRLRLQGSGWLDLVAPAGIWIPPDTVFDGIAGERRVTASITHFSGTSDRERAPLRIAGGAQAGALQGMIELSQAYAAEHTPDRVRVRLLGAILDLFERIRAEPASTDPVQRAWQLAADRLQAIRGLGDVAALAGLSESAFRRQHRARMNTSAGQHLIALRINAAKSLLAATNLPVHLIARRVGYGHPESCFHAFRRHVGQTPLAFRRNSAPFA